jgi:branched-chain amino acid transport system substrate-binding protein
VQAIEDADPDVNMMSLLEDTAIVFVSEVRALGMEQRLVCGNGCNPGSFIQATGEASEGLVVGAAWHIDREIEQSDGFVERYRDTYGVDPDQFSAQGYAGVQVVAEAIRRAGSTDHDAVRDALAGIQDFETVLGTFSFDSHRDAQHPAIIQIVQGGEFVVLR